MTSPPRGSGRKADELDDLIARHEGRYGLTVGSAGARRILGVARTSLRKAIADGRIRPLGRRGGRTTGRLTFSTAALVRYLVGADGGAR